jgi:hypothetical protein
MKKILAGIKSRAEGLFEEEVEMSNFPFNFGFMQDDHMEASYDRLKTEGVDVDMVLSKVSESAKAELTQAMFEDYKNGHLNYDKELFKNDGMVYDMYHAAQYGGIIDGYFEKRFNDMIGIGNQLKLAI